MAHSANILVLCVSGDAVTLLDINNSVPKDLFEEDIVPNIKTTLSKIHSWASIAVILPMCKLAKGAIKYQLIQNRLLENGGTPDITRGTLEGDIAQVKSHSIVSKSNAADNYVLI